MTTRSALALMLLLSPVIQAQTLAPEITASDIRTHIKYLASDELAGRGSGTPGNEAAARYIAGYLRQWGLTALGDSGTYFQHFQFVSSVRAGAGNVLRFQGKPVAGGTLNAVPDADFRPLGFTSNGTVSGPLVFAGYGITASDSSYDDFRNLDVTGKIIVVLRFSPDGSDPHGTLTRYSSFQAKTRAARDRGAVGFIVVTGPADEQEDGLIRLKFDQSFGNAGIPAVCLRRSVIEPLLASSGWTLRAIQDSIKSRKSPVAFPVAGVSATLTTDVEKVSTTTANVIGYLPGADGALKEQVVVLGAHFDHLGMGGEGSGSLQPDTVAIHHGADDNASGTAGLLELAQAFAANRSSLKRGLVFAFFSGEELGTLGSAYYVNNPPIPLARTSTMVNMDMIGRLEGKTLTVYGTGTSPEWNALLAKDNADSSFTLKEVPDGFGPSDHAQFYGKDVPVLFFFTGTHTDYHRPSDTWDKINYQGEERVVRFVYRIAGEIDGEQGRPVFARTVSSAPSEGGDTRGFRTTLAIIPDYNGGVDGMKISVVRPGGPAEKAGLKAGDIIVKMAGKKIVNIYDYMELLGKLKGGDKVDLVVLRDGKSINCTAEMAARK
jgi:aminopeptidase YwaD